MSEVDLLIALPAYGGSIANASVASLLRLPPSITAKRISFDIKDMSDIALARNYWGSMSARSRHTHVLMIDSDMTYQPSTISKMLAANKDVVGCVCPKKSTKPSFNVKLLSGRVDMDKDGLARVAGVGAGIILIKTQCFRQMIETCKVPSYTKHPFENPDGPLYGFFDRWPLDQTYLQEDYSFCIRWQTLCRGEVWALFNEPIGHVGQFEFSHKYNDTRSSPSPALD